MEHNLGALPYQIDFKTNHTPDYEIMDWIRNNTTRVQHLIDEEPRLSRWWFESIDTALKAISMIQEKDSETEYRLVCHALSGIFIQHGEF